jgi:hypothetical protein
MAFLEAIENTWRPRPLKRLAQTVESMKRWLLSEGLLTEVPEWDHGREATDLCWNDFNRYRTREAINVRESLTRWGNQYKIAAIGAWIMDAALQTSAFAAFREQSNQIEWVYWPTERTWPKLSAKLSNLRWFGKPTESWSNFARRTHRKLEAKLKTYRRVIESMSIDGDVRDKERRDATWLARYVAGESWEQIAAELETSEEPKSLVRNTSVRLAERISIKLPARPPGRRRRKRHSSPSASLLRRS